MRWVRVFALSAFMALQASSAAFAAPLSETKLTASDARAFHYFGGSLSIDADTVVVRSQINAFRSLPSTCKGCERP